MTTSTTNGSAASPAATSTAASAPGHTPDGASIAAGGPPAISYQNVSVPRLWLLLTEWQVRRCVPYLPLLILVQTLLAVATVIGFGFLLKDIPPQMALALTTGAPTVTLILVGLVMTPQMVAQTKTDGSLTWMRTLPVPRLLFLAADLTIWTLIALPGVVLAVLVGAWRFDLQLAISPWVVPGALLVSLTAAAVGYALASLLAPQLAMLMSQALLFVVMFFSPMYFPATNLPAWLEAAHKVLPFQPAADIMRAGLDHVTFAVPPSEVAVLAIWCAASVALAAWTLRRRD